MRIILIGFMGSGKTTLGKKIANKLQIPFIDSDQEIEYSEGNSIQSIFDIHGEEYFRRLEMDFIQSLKDKESFVLSTGGGMPCFNNMIEELNRLGSTCYIKLHPKELVQRLYNAKKTVRPLIRGKSKSDLESYVVSTLAQREMQYLKANVIINRNERTAVRIIEKLEDGKGC